MENNNGTEEFHSKVFDTIMKVVKEYSARHPQLKVSGELFFMDYIMAAVKGFDADYYVPGSFNCSNFTKYFEIDAVRTTTNFRIKDTST